MILFIPAMLLQGCWLSPAEFDIPAEPVVSPERILPPSEIPSTHIPSEPGKFSLRYDSNSPINPITSLNRDNILLSSLLYESLFILDSSLKAEPLLCEKWSTSDNITFTFELKPDIAMSDGSLLTADDVVYSIKQSMLAGRFINRFKSIASITSDEELTVIISLTAPNSRFINLLDVPIIKNGSVNRRIPPGTGPYIFVEIELEPEVDPENQVDPDAEADDETESGTEPVINTETGAEPGVENDIKIETMWLEPFPQHRDYANMPIPIVHLRECDDSELTELFDDGELSLLWDDPSDAFDIRINRLPEKHFYNTTALQFIGFNARKGIMGDSDIRRAIACSIDRQYITDNIFTAQEAVASPLALSPAFGLYDTQWEQRRLDPLVEMALLLDSALLVDCDDDSYLELTDGLGGYEEITVDFIVNIENTHRTQAAHKIADTLWRIGFNITVRELPWDTYLEALQKGDFDMYYGEVVLNADFDLSPLLLPGSNLNYGGTCSTEYIPFVADFLAARSDREIRFAAERLCNEISVYAPFAPVLYKKYAMYVPMGAVSNAAPSQSSVFYNFSSWKFDMTMLT